MSPRALQVLSGKARAAVQLADNLAFLPLLPDESVDLVYVDPPFNTGKAQKRQRLRTTRSDTGDRIGFGGKSYRTERLGSLQYADQWDDYLGFLRPRMEQAWRVLKPTGSLYLHIDYREVHYVKVLLDELFGRSSFMNEIIWAYDYGGRPRDRWPAKHDNILFYAKSPGKHVWNRDAIDRIAYMAPELVGEEKAARGKLPTDTWWHTIVSPTGKEKLGYPTQKPLGIVRRIVVASSPEDGVVLDFFAGSGTTGAAALAEGRRAILVDDHLPAYQIMQQRFAGAPGVLFQDALDTR